MTLPTAPELTAVTTVANSAIQLGPHERQPCEVWTRVMGYHRPVASFNPGKQAEFAERQFFTEARALPYLRG